MNEVGIFKRVTDAGTEVNHSKLLRMPAKPDIKKTALLFLVSRAGIIGIHPFGAAMFAGMYDKKIAYIGILSVLAGLLSTGAGADSVKYIFAMMLFWLYSRINENYKQHIILSSAVCGLGIIAGGISAFAYQEVTLYSAALLVADGIVGAFSYIVFDYSEESFMSGMKRDKLKQEEVICICIAGGIIINGFGGIELPFDISVTKLLAGYSVMAIAMHTSMAVTGTGGIALGLMCGNEISNAASLMGIYGFSALMASSLKSFGKYGIAIGFLSAGAIIMLFEGTSLSMPLTPFEMITAGLLFMLTPKRLHTNMASLFSKIHFDEFVKPEIKVKQHLMLRLQNTAAAFARLAKSFAGVSEKRLDTSSGDVASIFDDTADRVCKKCNMCSYCWQRGFNDTYRNMFILLSRLEDKGSISADDLPDDFKCIKAEAFTSAFSHIYELYKQKAVWAGEMAQNRDMIASQYLEISDIIGRFRDEIEQGFEFMDELEEMIADELEKRNITAYGINVIKTISNEFEIYIKSDAYPSILSEAVSDILGINMSVDADFDKSIIRLISKSGFDVDVSVRQLPKDGQAVNGDTCTEFYTEDHKYVMIISDGMGSGIKAMEQSVTTAELIKDFMKAGLYRKSGMSLINSSLALKSEDEIFSTVDMFVLDLIHGTGEFIKAGATESYIKSKNGTDTVFSASLPVGILADTKFSPERRQLAKGDIIVMMSDGVSDSGKSLVRGEWIKKILNTDYASADELAEKIMDGAIKRSKGRAADDMSLAVIRIN